MNLPEGLAEFLTIFISKMKTESVEWQKKYQPDLLNLREEKAVAEQNLKHKLEEMEIRFRKECKRIENEEETKTRNFQDFIESVDDLKFEIIKRYPQMPRPLALLIHHHATQLLIAAWNSPNPQDAQNNQSKFLKLILTATEDLSLLNSANQTPNQLPEKTIELIKSKNYS